MGQFDQARRIVIAALRTNHRGYKQIKGRLARPDSEDRCATGLVAEALHIHIGSTETPAYEAVKAALGDMGVTSFIVERNDHSSHTYTQIADQLERRWFGK
jgi:hypothetical protein